MTSTVRLFLAFILLSPVVLPSVRAQDADFEALLNDLNPMAESTATEASASAESTAENLVPVEAETAGAAPVAESVIEIDMAGETAEAPSSELAETVDLEAETAPAVETEAAQPVESIEAGADATTESAAPAATPSSEADILAQQEEVRRQAADEQSRKNYAAAKQALEKKNYEEAVRLLEAANLDLPQRPKNDKLRDQIQLQLLDAYVRLAREKIDTDINFARKNIDAALKLSPDNERALAVQKKIAARERDIAEELARPRSVMEQPKYSEKYASVDELLRNGRDLFEAREYNDAETVFEQVLFLDEYNAEAMRYLKKLEERRLDLRTKEREATVAGMIADVRDTWNTPIRGDSKAPVMAQQETKIDTLSAQQKLQKKMENIIIPQLSFRQANINDVVDFLVTNSVSGDAEGTGVNIILKLESGRSGGSSAPSSMDEGGLGSDSGEGVEPLDTGSGSVPLISLNLRRITLLDAIQYVTEVADLRYRLEENAVIITPANVASGRIVTRMYPVQPSILDVITEKEGLSEQQERRQGDYISMGSSDSMKRTDVKVFFERAGVQFPKGTSITYNPTISQLIVANTVENLENFERILSRLNVIPNQVEIEARFVEVNQDNLEELGLQWFLTDKWEIAQKKGGAMPSSTETIVMNSDSRGVTKGNRFFSFDDVSGTVNPISAALFDAATQTPMGNVASFASVLTNPELQVVVNALSQKGNSDLLSAPRVTTRSGVAANIKLVKEIIYPVSYDTEAVSEGDRLVISDVAEPSPDTDITDLFTAAPPIAIYPAEFKTREVGVILDVTPTVGPDGYTIDLLLTPEVADFVDWLTYGTPPYNQIQPVFSSRKVATSVVVWDGQTIVLGGLIREDLVKYEDKIPFLGDIPLIGRLFRSEGEYSQKKNLLIFVTARLVGPDGRPIQRGDEMPESGETAEVATP